ncbi:copia protein [Tanacetum coccineum]|uniref:Copia protein n=1 Tax=Tanacetum coccineum TaxID=301880 RepID=A0ABQ5H9W9_9ASTR
MTTLAEYIIVARAENRPPMLEKSMYDSWASRIRLFIKEKKHGRMMLGSIDNGLLVYPTVEENGQTRPMKYSELTEAQQLQDYRDVQATNIILHGLPPDVYALVNHQEAANDIWDRVKLLMKGTELSYQERDKFVTDVKLAKSLYTTNYDQLYEYLSQHERHVNEVRITRERYPDPLALVANFLTLYNPSQSPQHSGSLMYPPPQHFTPVYAALIHHQHHHTLVNLQQHSVSPQPFISPSVTQQNQAEFPKLDSSLVVPITSSNLRNQATIQDGRVTVQQVQGRQTQSYVGTGNRGIATTSKGNYAACQLRVMKCYNCQREGHMARQCTQPKRPRNAAWFKEKLMLAKAEEAGQILDEEKLAFLANPGISEALVAQQTIPQNSAFQTEDLDAYDSDCDDLSSAKAVLMANLSSCDPEVLSEVPYSDSYPNDMINQDVQEMHYSEQTHIGDFQDNEIHSDSNIIPYS